MTKCDKGGKSRRRRILRLDPRSSAFAKRDRDVALPRHPRRHAPPVAFGRKGDSLHQAWNWEKFHGPL